MCWNWVLKIAWEKEKRVWNNVWKRWWQHWKRCYAFFSPTKFSVFFFNGPILFFFRLQAQAINRIFGCNRLVWRAHWLGHYTMHAFHFRKHAVPDSVKWAFWWHLFNRSIPKVSVFVIKTLHHGEIEDYYRKILLFLLKHAKQMMRIE